MLALKAPCAQALYLSLGGRVSDASASVAGLGSRAIPDARVPTTYAAIEALRAVAALWVVGAHCMIWGGWYWQGLPSAKFAVDLFMMVSGFLMVAQADARAAVEPLVGVRNRWRFWARRYFRLAPAYYLSLLAAAGAAPLFLGGYTALRAASPMQWQFDTTYDPAGIEYSATNILLHVTFLFGLLPEWSFSTMLPDWSLSLEMQFYVAFPALLLAFNRWGVRAIIAIGIAAVVLASGLPRFREPSLLLFGLPYFLAGMLVCRARTAGMSAAAVLVAGLGGSVVPPVLAIGMLVLLHFEGLGRLPAFFSWRLIRFGSEASYAVYLFHGFAIAAFGLALSTSTALQALSPPARVAAMLATVIPAAYGCAWLIYRWVEQPGIELGRRLLQSFGGRPAPSYDALAKPGAVVAEPKESRPCGDTADRAASTFSGGTARAAPGQRARRDRLRRPRISRPRARLRGA